MPKRYDVVVIDRVMAGSCPAGAKLHALIKTMLLADFEIPIELITNEPGRPRNQQRPW